MAKGKYEYWLSEEGLTLLEGWARDGLTDEQIAANAGIAPSTLYAWKKDHREISEALKKGKEVVDIQVENALLKRALGYEYLEKRVEVSDKDGKRVIETVKQVIPNITAQIFWLKNRRPDRWRDKQEVSMDEETRKALAARSLTMEEKLALIRDVSQEMETHGGGGPGPGKD